MGSLQGDRMKRNLSIALLIFILSLILTDIVMAAYYIDIDVTESNSNDYDMLAMNVSMDIDYLADNGFINADGLDVRVKNSGGSELPFMLADDKLMFASALEGDKTTGFQMTTGNTEISSYPVIVGDGGYVTIADTANLELGSDFELEWDGYIDTSISDDLISKTDAFDVSTDGAGHIVATIYCPDDIEQANSDGYIELRAGAYVRGGERIDDFPISIISQVSFYLTKSGTPTGTAYCRIRRVSDDGIVGTLGSVDVSTLSGAWYDFTSDVTNPTEQDLRFTLEYSGGDASNKVRLYTQTVNPYADGDLTYYTTSWADNGAQDARFKILFADDITVTASVTVGEHTIRVTGDNSDIKIYEDGNEEDSETIISIQDNANNWVIANIPYMSYYKHTTSDTLRVTYEPDDIISGTTLPNEENPGTYDGTITWGSNPAGISITHSGLEVEDSYYYTGGGGATTDIFEPEPAELVTGLDSDKLDHNPLSPGVQGFAEASNGAFTESLVWYGIAWFSVIAVGIALLVLVREHLVFAATCAFGLSIFWYVSGVFDYWVLIILGILFGASLIHERMPTW